MRILMIIFVLVVFFPLTGITEESLPCIDPAPPVLHPVPDSIETPGPQKHPRTMLFKTARALSDNAITADWPNFLGPTHDGVSTETCVLSHFEQPIPDRPHPQLVWSIEKGESYSAPSIKDKKLILFHRMNNNEIVECLDAENGELYWTYSYPTTYRDKFNYLNGPRATPSISENRVYTLGAQGMLHCFDLNTGHLYWQRNLARTFEADEDFFGFTSSPLVEANTVFINLGGNKGACVAAFNKHIGALEWLSGSLWGRSYATPIVANMYDRRILFVFAGGMSKPPVGGLLGIDPASGKIHFRFPWRSPRYFSVNASSPVVSGNHVFISSSYDIYGAMLEIQPDLSHKLIYTTKTYGSHWTTPILRNGYLYGFANDKLVCMNWQTGQLIWSERLRTADEKESPDAAASEPGIRSGAEQYRQSPDSNTFGFGSLVWADNHFICLGETGLLACLDLSPDGCRIISSCRLFNASQTWTAPVLSKGLLYITQNRTSPESPPRLLCYDLRAQ